MDVYNSQVYFFDKLVDTGVTKLITGSIALPMKMKSRIDSSFFLFSVFTRFVFARLLTLLSESCTHHYYYGVANVSSILSVMLSNKKSPTEQTFNHQTVSVLSKAS